MKSNRSPYRSFSLKHNDETRHTYLALLAADGRLAVFENDQPENLAEFAPLDDLAVCAKPARGEETCFRVRFDPNPDPCYTALRAGVPTDALALVVAALDTVKIYRTREITTSSMGNFGSSKEFYLAAEIPGHRGLVRDVAWAPGNIRGYDIVATACQDGFVRVMRIDTPFDPKDGKSWSVSDLVRGGKDKDISQAQAGLASKLAGAASGIRAEIEKTGGPSGDRRAGGQPGQIAHTVKELSKLDSHRTPVWRVDFDDDGQILGSVGDDGKLMCYRQTPEGLWAKSSELAMMRVRMAAP